jgi:hypothetical protein
MVSAFSMFQTYVCYVFFLPPIGDVEAQLAVALTTKFDSQPPRWSHICCVIPYKSMVFLQGCVYRILQQY